MSRKAWRPGLTIKLPLQGFTPPNQKVRARKFRPLVAASNVVLFATMPVWGGLLVFSVFAWGFLRRDPEWKDYLLGRMSVLRGLGDLYTP